MEDVSSLLARGQAARKVGETALNRESSRSHSVFTCTLECSSTDARGVTQILHARLNLVDLAGAHLPPPHCGLAPSTLKEGAQSVPQKECLPRLTAISCGLHALTRSPYPGKWSEARGGLTQQNAISRTTSWSTLCWCNLQHVRQRHR